MNVFLLGAALSNVNNYSSLPVFVFECFQEYLEASPRLVEDSFTRIEPFGAECTY